MGPMVEPTKPKGLQLIPGDGEITAQWKVAERAPNGYLVRIRRRGSNRILAAEVVENTRTTFTGLQNGVDHVVLVDTNFNSDKMVAKPRKHASGAIKPMDTPTPNPTPEPVLSMPQLGYQVADKLGETDQELTTKIDQMYWELKTLSAEGRKAVLFRNLLVASWDWRPLMAGVIDLLWKLTWSYSSQPITNGFSIVANNAARPAKNQFRTEVSLLQTRSMKKSDFMRMVEGKLYGHDRMDSELLKVSQHLDKIGDSFAKLNESTLPVPQDAETDWATRKTKFAGLLQGAKDKVAELDAVIDSRKATIEAFIDDFNGDETAPA